MKYTVTSDLIKRNKKQARNKGVSSIPEEEVIPETEKTQQVLMVEVENLKDEPYEKTMEIKVCVFNIIIFFCNLILYLTNGMCLFALGTIPRNNKNYSISDQHKSYL